ncbi:MAG: dTDP-glucose 4,6-dehydratase [Bacteroidia bacterium]|jgi:dTDP-glucose 4,6-dehydratase
MNSRPPRSILVTGGAGFIGSHAVEHWVKTYPEDRLVVLDKLTYAGHVANLASCNGLGKWELVQGDICDASLVGDLFSKHQFDGVLHLAAESHVDRSIANPMEFVQTNVVGTLCLLNAALQAWGEHADRERYLFYHISTDEVYGSLGPEGLFSETTAYDPRSPYSASKAASDHLVRAYHHTYGLPVVLSNCSNNYGPRQYPEKLIPVVVQALAEGRSIPVYGAGANVRDWLYVGDHVRAMEAIFHRGRNGETYNVGGNNEWNNLDLVRLLCRVYDQLHGRPDGTGEAQIAFVTDRKGHDLRYAIDATKIRNELGWTPKTNFEEGLLQTVRFYSPAI